MRLVNIQISWTSYFPLVTMLNFNLFIKISLNLKVQMPISNICEDCHRKHLQKKYRLNSFITVGVFTSMRSNVKHNFNLSLKSLIKV